MSVSPELTRHDHSIIACSLHIDMVLFFALIPFVVNCAFQRNASGEVATAGVLQKVGIIQVYSHIAETHVWKGHIPVQKRSML